MIYCESKFCKLIKERGIRYKTEKILKKNFEKPQNNPEVKTTALSRQAGNHPFKNIFKVVR